MHVLKVGQVCKRLHAVHSKPFPVKIWGTITVKRPFATPRDITAAMGWIAKCRRCIERVNVTGSKDFNHRGDFLAIAEGLAGALDSADFEIALTATDVTLDLLYLNNDFDWVLLGADNLAKRLVELRMCDNTFKPNKGDIMQLQPLTALRHLQLCGAPNDWRHGKANAGAAAAAPFELPQLHTLELEYWEMPASLLLPPAVSMPRLQHLKVRDADGSDVRLEAAIRQLSGLQSLALTFSEDAWPEALAEGIWGSVSSLTQLTALETESLEAWSQGAGSLPRLQVLRLQAWDGMCTDETIEAVLRLPQLKSLILLEFRDWEGECYWIGRLQRRMQEANPGCKIAATLLESMSDV